MKLKKLFAGLISLAAALLAVCAITVCAGAETSGDYEYYALDDKTVEITRYTGSATNLTIPSTIDGKKVTEIWWCAFADCSSLALVTLPNTVTIIDDYAFRDCSSLTSVILPDGLTSIGVGAFRNCLKLNSITIPDSVTNIGNSAFSGTPFLNNQTTTVKYAGKCAIACDENATTATIKSGTVDIADYAFYHCSNLTSVVIPKGVKKIGNYAFSSCNISSIKIPDGVTSIGDFAFSNCSKLASVTLPDSITKIGDDAFKNIPLINNQTSAVKYVGKWAVCCEGKADMPYGEEKSSSSNGAVTYIDNDNLFVTIKSGTVGIADNAFYFCENVLSLVLPDGIKYIGSYAFDHCIRLISIKIPDSVKKIEDATFDGCTSLTSVTIPDSITSIGEYAFNLCMSINNVFYTGSKTQWDKIAVGEHNDELLNGNIHYNYVIAPSAVTGLKLKGRSGDALRISWTKNTSSDGYIIEMKDGSKWVRVGKITKNSTVEFRKDKLKAGTAYSFRVKAYKMSGKTALYGATKTISARTNPTAISGLKVKATAKSSICIAWEKNMSADGYIIEMKDGDTWKRVGKLKDSSAEEFNKYQLKAGTAYTFRVKTYKMSGKTALYGATKTISARTNPTAISGLKLKVSAKSSICLAWEKNMSADGYIIEMKDGDTWKRVGKLKDNSVVEFNKYQLKAGTTYTFRVKTYKMSGKTALYGATKTITVKTK